jgi:hypothetical protein
MRAANVLLELPKGAGEIKSGETLNALVIGQFGNDIIPSSISFDVKDDGCCYRHHEQNLRKELEKPESPLRIGLLICSDRVSSGLAEDKCHVIFHCGF